MKRNILITATVLVVAVGGFLAWRNYHTGCCSGSIGCTSTSGNYNTKMSMVCELSCAAKDVDESKLVAQSTAKAGDFTKCPISGVAFLVKDQSSKISHNGKSVFTCCETCAEIFSKSPGEYASNIH